jgi:hypothetical protein
MTITVVELLAGAMRKIGVLGAGEVLTDEADDVRVVFQQMVDAWTNEDLLIPTVTKITFPLIEQNNYTIGIYPAPVPVPLPVNHIETARPERILRAWTRDSASVDYPLKVLDSDYYARITVKDNVARPGGYYLRKGWPLDSIFFDQVPFVGETLHLEVIQPLTDVLPAANLTDIIDLPPGYERALLYNLALELAPEWGKDVPSTVAVFAVQSKKLLKRANKRKSILRVDSAIIQRDNYDINSGPY